MITSLVLIFFGWYIVYLLLEIDTYFEDKALDDYHSGEYGKKYDQKEKNKKPIRTKIGKV